MKPYEFMRFYHPKLGRFVHQHKGSGIIVDNIFKPMKSVVSSVVKKFAKKSGQKALKSGISHLSEKAGKKMAEKSGDLIMKRLRNMRIDDARQRSKVVPPIKKQDETDMIIDRLISGSGLKRRKRVKFI